MPSQRAAVPASGGQQHDQARSRVTPSDHRGRGDRDVGASSAARRPDPARAARTSPIDDHEARRRHGAGCRAARTRASAAAGRRGAAGGVVDRIDATTRTPTTRAASTDELQRRRPRERRALDRAPGTVRARRRAAARPRRRRAAPRRARRSGSSAHGTAQRGSRARALLRSARDAVVRAEGCDGGAEAGRARHPGPARGIDSPAGARRAAPCRVSQPAAGRGDPGTHARGACGGRRPRPRLRRRIATMASGDARSATEHEHRHEQADRDHALLDARAQRSGGRRRGGARRWTTITAPADRPQPEMGDEEPVPERRAVNPDESVGARLGHRPGRGRRRTARPARRR